MELEFLQFLILLIITGVFSGLIAGLLGVGGGLVIIPVVFYILNFYGFTTNIIMHVALLHQSELYVLLRFHPFMLIIN